MRIVQIAPLEEPIPPKRYSGVEIVVYNLVEEMVRLGHEVYLLGPGSSQTSAHLVPIMPQSIYQSYGEDELGQWEEFIKSYHISTVLTKIRELQPDIVHNHFAWRLIQFEEFIDCPMYSTVHGDLSSMYERFTYSQHPDANYISISDVQREAMPDLNWVRTIYNGVDVSKFQVGKPQDRRYFVFLGKASPGKGLQEICQLIKSTSHQLKIAAKVDPADRAYFEQEIKPLIDGKQITFVGEVDYAGKVKLLKHALGLLLWNWHEPFALVTSEAMASGTPVISNSCGSMGEFIVNKKTGFLVKSLPEMKRKLEQVASINPQDCVAHVRGRFSAQVMTRAYLQLAGKLTN